MSDPLLALVHTNRTAYRALLEGEPALARLRQQQAPHGEFAGALAYVGRWGELIVGLTYQLHDGHTTVVAQYGGDEAAVSTYAS